jgi:butyrate kinase
MTPKRIKQLRGVPATDVEANHLDECLDEIERLSASTVISKREHFAALAMQGVLARSERQSTQSVAEIAVACADALLEVLDKPR